MSKHKPPSAKRHRIDKQARYRRKLAKRKLYQGLTAPKSGYVKLARRRK